MKPQISVILTCYNFRRYLREALLSLLNQSTQRGFEVILIDDASGDGSLAAVADLRDSRLRIVAHAQNQGAAASINEGFALASGQYIARFDGDDVWSPDALECLASALDRYPEASVAYGDIRTLDSTGALGAEGIQRPEGPECRDEFALLLATHYTCAPAMMSRRTAWNGLLPWPETFRSGLGDWYFNLRLAQKGKFAFVAKVLANYRVHDGGMHYQFVRDRTGERNMRIILDELLPRDTVGRLSKAAIAIQAEHLRLLANGYYGQGMEQDARRVYRELLRFAPGKLWHRHSLMPALASMTIGRRRYEGLKRCLLPRR